MALSRPCVVLVCVVLLHLTACSSDSKSPEAASLSAPSSSASASTSPSTSTEPTSSSSVACDALPPPASAINVSQADGDFNGDSIPDTLTVYGTGTTTQPSPYHVQIELGDSKGAVDTAIVDAATDNTQVVKALGGADITASAGSPPDGSGAEAFVQVGSGASASLVGVYQLVGCTLNRLVGPQGAQPSLFAIGGSVTHLDGLRCDGGLVKLSATSDDGVTYETQETRLQVQDGKFNLLGTPVTNTVDSSDASLQSFSALDCVGVQSP